MEYTGNTMFWELEKLKETFNVVLENSNLRYWRSSCGKEHNTRPQRLIDWYRK